MGEIWSGKRIRDTYFNFFKDRGHTEVDRTLLFTSGGMNQHKPRFLEVADPQSEFMNLKRACHSQKWIRAGESHSDLEKVGTLDYHHTSFETLGNWSFGDYFKEEAIAWAWELLTKVYGLEADHIYATYFGGDEKAGLEPDNEARDIWLRFLPSRRVLPFGYKDNFWEMGGDTGLCSKIHYHRDAATCIQIWNLLFIQRDGSVKAVDTRLDYERLTSILQAKVTSYDTDLFIPLYEDISKLTGVPTYKPEMSYVTESYRVVADHMTTVCLAIAHGSQIGDEYALTRLLQRSIRFGMVFLRGRQGFFSGLVKSIVRVRGEFYTELKEHEATITEIIRAAESEFCSLMEYVIEFNDSEKPDHLRSKALIELTNMDISDQNVAQLLWYSKTTALLVQVMQKLRSVTQI